MTPDARRPEEILDVNRRWLPPAPHIDRVIEKVLKGSAHIEKRGHHEAPLLVFEDGGVIELPNVRYEMTARGMELVSSQESVETGLTKFTDVCGCVDYMKGVLRDDPAAARRDPRIFDRLLDDALYMIDRMEKREAAYRKFVADVILACVDVPRGASPEAAASAVQEIKTLLRGHPNDVAKHVDLLNQLAEDIRSVADGQEKCLAAFRQLAMNIGALYNEVRGARRWDEGKSWKAETM